VEKSSGINNEEEVSSGCDEDMGLTVKHGTDQIRVLQAYIQYSSLLPRTL
jgi:hypothetical protein